ncbi:MAG: hypothetical protein HY913_19280 [Desulfomonile tiedjei]|nr:hypothetical protein [Desulfomonile tiedjei]
MELSRYEDRVETKIQEWNERIEQLKIDAQDAGSERRKACEEEIESLIANREAVRRGLLRLSETGEELCSSCPAEQAPTKEGLGEEEGLLERIVSEPYDPIRSPRTTYGRED